MDRVALYLRVSTDEQATAGTIETQSVACRDYCRQRGLEVVEEYRDEGVSGTIPFVNRPAAARLLHDAGADRFETVLVYRLDRLARALEEGIAAAKHLKRTGTNVMSVSENWDDTSNGVFIFQLFLGVAELEKNIIRERTMAGRARRVGNGLYQSSHVPFGYLKENGKLVPDPETTPIVRQMFEWALSGLGLKVIANRLDSEGIPPPSWRHPDQQSAWGWHFSSVHKILTATRYVGRATYGRRGRKGTSSFEGIPMACPAIIDESTFDAVQVALKERKRNSARNTRHVYPLQHLLRCRECKSRYRVKSNGDRRFYECYRRATYGPKAGHDGIKWHWQAEEIESVIESAILNFESNPAQFDETLEIYRERLVAERECNEAETRQFARRLDELTVEEHRAIGFAVSGRINDAQLASQLDRIRDERLDLQARLKPLQAADDLSQAEIDSVIERLRSGQPNRKRAKNGTPKKHFQQTKQKKRIRIQSPKRDDFQWKTDLEAMIGEIWVESDGTFTATGRVGDLLDLMPESAILGPLDEPCDFPSFR
jgi:site-specific DNA recombinase